MMISLFFSFHYFEAPPDHLRVFFSDPPSRDVDLSKENIIAPPPLPQHISTTWRLQLGGASSDGRAKFSLRFGT